MALQGYDVLKLDTTGMTYSGLNQIAGDLALSKGILRLENCRNLETEKKRGFLTCPEKQVASLGSLGCISSNGNSQ